MFLTLTKHITLSACLPGLQRVIISLAVSALLMATSSGCNWCSPARAHKTLQNSQALMEGQKYHEALLILRASKTEKPPQGQPRLAIWKPWDRIAYWMEEGMLAFLAQRYDDSISSLLKAEHFKARHQTAWSSNSSSCRFQNHRSAYIG